MGRGYCCSACSGIDCITMAWKFAASIAAIMAGDGCGEYRLGGIGCLRCWLEVAIFAASEGLYRSGTSSLKKFVFGRTGGRGISWLSGRPSRCLTARDIAAAVTDCVDELDDLPDDLLLAPLRITCLGLVSKLPLGVVSTVVVGVAVEASAVFVADVDAAVSRAALLRFGFLRCRFSETIVWSEAVWVGSCSMAGVSRVLYAGLAAGMTSVVVRDTDILASILILLGCLEVRLYDRVHLSTFPSPRHLYLR